MRKIQKMGSSVFCNFTTKTAIPKSLAKRGDYGNPLPLRERPLFNSGRLPADDDDDEEESLDNDMCLLVDKTDNFLGTATKRECHRVGVDGKLRLHRAFSVLMFNTAGEILVQKRAKHKVTFPNCYTNACCSHPLFVNGAQEDVTTAAMRRLDFELGISKHQVQPKDFTLLARFLYMDPGDGVWGEYELDYVLILQTDIEVKPNPDEIAEVKYVPRNKFDNFIANLEDPVTPWFKLIHHHMLHFWWDNLHRLPEIADPQKIHSFINKV